MGKKAFIPQPERARLIQPLLRHMEGTEIQQPLPPREGTWPPLMPSHPLTPPPSSYFYAVRSYSLILILRALIYTFENPNH